MVKMESYYPQDQFRELSMKIHQLHLSYLDIEESPEKLDHRLKLEGCILEFLSIVPHNQKFVLPETEEIFYRSASLKKGFSGYKGATGWDALQIYAGNLIAQPWRKEYRQIKTYCGFYKHHIEANLLSAERMFEAMGYKHLGNGVLIMEGPICPDQVISVSRDCLVAYVECQIMKHIWEEVSQSVTWLDILEYRRKFPGNPENCIKNLKYGSMQLSMPQVPAPVPQISFYGRHPNTYLPYNYMPCTIPFPVAPSGYYYGNTLPPVPTGQLIPLEAQNNFDLLDGASSTIRKPQNSYHHRTVVKNEEDKQETEEDWDYVYRNLEKQGYSKDLGERGDVLGLGGNEKRQQRRHSKEGKRVKATNLDDVINNLSVNDRPLKITEALEKMEQKPVEKNVQVKERRHSHSSSYENVSPADGLKTLSSRSAQSVATQTKPVVKEKSEKNSQKIVNQMEPVKIKEKGPVSGKWQCKSCTFLNDQLKDICEICSKSRNVGEEQPMEVGGAECSKCTLVNPKSIKTCQACGNSLKDSPTYI